MKGPKFRGNQTKNHFANRRGKDGTDHKKDKILEGKKKRVREGRQEGAQQPPKD